jgi:hypothetical protein
MASNSSCKRIKDGGLCQHDFLREARLSQTPAVNGIIPFVIPFFGE